MGLVDSLLTVFGRYRPSVHARTASRLTVDEPLRFSVQPHPAFNFSGMLEDLSATGARIRSHQRLNHGDRIVLRLNFGSGLNCEAPARIVHVRAEPGGFHFRYGLRFVGLQGIERRQIAEFISSQKHGREFGVRAFPQESVR